MNIAKCTTVAARTDPQNQVSNDFLNRSFAVSRGEPSGTCSNSLSLIVSPCVAMPGSHALEDRVIRPSGPGCSH